MLYTDSLVGDADAVARHANFAQITCFLQRRRELMMMIMSF